MSLHGLLQAIAASRREAVRPLYARREELRRRALASSPPRSFAASLREGAEVALIAEVKRASPSRGVIREDLDPARLALAYRRGGARAVSVLVEERFFRGGEEDFRKVREAVDLPLLWKDFVLTPEQVYLARSLGADACLLIAGLLREEELSFLLSACREVGMEALVEVHDEEDLRLALYLGAELIGINNRDLRSFRVDLGTTERLAPLVPPSFTLVGESGIRSREDVERLARVGVDACLVGEALASLPEEEVEIRVRELASVPRFSGTRRATLFSPGRVAVKICGLRRPEEVRAAREAGADLCGFVFWPRSRRAVTREEAREAAREAGALLKVGVFVDAPWEEVAEAAKEVPLDVVQLHGREEPDYVLWLRRVLPDVLILKALAAEGDGSSGLQPLGRAAEYGDLVDGYLLDSGHVAPGGTGRSFPWHLVDVSWLPRPFFLAGGLTPSNVREALFSLRPQGVDVSSGVEREGGKDPRLIRHFVEEVRRWEKDTSGPM